MTVITPSIKFMASRCAISIIIPVFNEAEILATLLGKVQALDLPQAEIIVVDDGSADGSAEIALNAGASVVRHPYNIGNGAAIKSGIRAARGKLIVLMDGDGQHKPEDIPNLLAEATNYHMVVGARAKGSKLRFHRYAANLLYNLLASYVTKFKVQDLTSGFRVLIAARCAALYRFAAQHVFLSDDSDAGVFTLRVDRQICADSDALPRRAEQNQPGHRRHSVSADHHQDRHVVFAVPGVFAGERRFFSWRGWRTISIPTSPSIASPICPCSMFTTAVIIFMLGLISEQIALLAHGTTWAFRRVSRRYRSISAFTLFL